MKSFEVSVPYRSITARGLVVFTVLWLILGIVLIFCVGMFLATFTSAPGLLGLVHDLMLDKLIIICLASVMLVVLGMVFSNYIEGNRIIANANGLNFPSLTGRNLAGKSSRSWSDVQGVMLSTSDPFSIGKDDYLRVTFKSGGAATLKLHKMPEPELEKLLLAIEMFSPNVVYDANFPLFQNSLQNKLQGVEGISYTQLWEDELSRRFSATSFIPLKPGEKLRNDSLIVERQLAFGGFSAVYLVKDLDGNSLVIKELAFEDQSEPGFEKAREMFKREAEILSALEHPRIASVLDRFSQNGREYMALEYIPGINLRQYVAARGKLEPVRVAELARQMADLLSYLHSQAPPVIHRDFTPDNLVLKDDGSLVLVDFGAANEFLGGATGTLVGKQCYMSPEQVRGKSQPGSDLFALGGTLFFLLTGKDPVALRASRPSSSLGDQGEIPEELDDLVEQLTQLDSARRPPSAQNLASRLTELRFEDSPIAISRKREVTT